MNLQKFNYLILFEQEGLNCCSEKTDPHASQVYKCPTHQVIQAMLVDCVKNQAKLGLNPSSAACQRCDP